MTTPNRQSFQPRLPTPIRQSLNRKSLTPTLSDSQDQHISTRKSAMESKFIAIKLTVEQVHDIIDETPIDRCAIKDVDIAVNQLEELRHVLRSERQNLQSQTDPNEQLTGSLLTALDSIKSYLKSAKDRNYRLEQIQTDQSKRSDISKKQSIEFAANELNRSIDEIKSKINVEFKTISDSKLLQLHENSSAIDSEIKELSKKYEQLLSNNVTDEALVAKISAAGTMYSKLRSSNVSYQQQLQTEVDERDIHKQKSFDESKLNIQLAKFSGYNSEIDIYSFQTLFNKLYFEKIPRRVLPDLLKNNLLKDPALSLVKNIADIDDIWA